jgi:hypothetical protein
MTSVADRTIRHLRHLREDDESDALLHGLAAGLVDGLEQAGEIAYGIDGDTPVPGERVLTDPAVCPFEQLEHAALWVGGTVPPRPPGMTEEQWHAYARDAVINPFGALRCSPRSLIILARAYMVPGAIDIRVVERYGGEPFLSLVVVRPEDVPDPGLLVKMLNGDDVIIAGGRVDVTLATSAVWSELMTTSWDDLDAITWAELLAGIYIP